MKKYTISIVKRNGEEKTGYVLVEDRTAEVLDTLDEETRRQYLQDEHEMYLNDLKETRRHRSLDYSIEKGFDIADGASTPEKILMETSAKELFYKALLSLKPKQLWLVEQVYFSGRKQRDVAKELGIDESAVSQRFDVIFKTLKNSLKNL